MLLPALQRKLVRDLLAMKGQALAIALVMASGIATFTLSSATLHSLERTMDTYYERYRFGQVFAHVKRSPQHVANQIAAIPGVADVQTRVVVDVNLSVEGMNEPALGRLISIDDDLLGSTDEETERQRDEVAEGAANHSVAPSLRLSISSTSTMMNGLYLRAGRWIEPGRAGEVMVSESFAKAHGLHPGDSVTAIINGRLDVLRIVGIALSPEYIYQIRPGDILPDDRRFGVLWMSERQLAPAFEMDGAFNDVSLTLNHNANELEVIRHLDDITDQYGSLGAYGREDHPSHKFVSNELRELRGMTVIAPTIFLLVAAFLLNVVMTRLIATQREQIATLKAFGYSNLEVGWHYLQMSLLIALVGAVIGSIAGAWMGHGMAKMYSAFFHFPILTFALEPRVPVMAVGIAMGASVIGTLSSVWRAVKLPPAQAMRPEPPANFRPTLIERIGLQNLVSPAARMILREIERRPWKAATSCLGIAMAAAVLVVGSFMKDAIDYVLDLQFNRAQRQTVTVSLTEPADGRAIAEMRHMPGVLAAEPFRSVAARLRNGQHHRRVGITALPERTELYRVMDLNGRVFQPDSDGIYMSTKLAELLHVRPGEQVTLEVLEKQRPVVEVPVAGLIDDFAGLSAYMRLDAVRRLMHEDDDISGAYLAAEAGEVDRLYAALKETPAVAGVALRSATIESFNAIIAENLLRMRLFNMLFAIIIAFGVVYNSARISLAERSRELATLRVMGFRRGEVSAILLGELAVLTLLAIPFGLLLGYALSAMVIHSVDSELFRIPLVVEPRTFGFAAVVVLVATVISAMLVRSRIDHLDLIGVLKTRE
jgi:putative ABC transport system permease protein